MYQKLRAKQALLTILFTIFVDMLGVGILIPVIPLLLADPRSPIISFRQASIQAATRVK